MSEKTETKVETTVAEPKVSLGYSGLTIALSVAVLFITAFVFKGKLQLGFLLASVVAFIMSMAKGFKYADLEKAAIEFAKKSLQADMFLFAVGIMIAMWISCGAVPTIIYYGLKLINPAVFLLVAVLLCSVGSVCTGSSWATLGSIGVAMMGISAGLGFDPAITAGAVICGSFFGDKMSPLSDTTNLCPAVSGCDIMSHIKHMFYTTVPSYAITLIFFLVVGFKHAGTDYDPSAAQEIMTTIAGNFNMGFIQILPVILVLVLLVLQKPAFLSIMAGGIGGFIVALITTNQTAADLISQMWSGFTLSSGVGVVDNLFTRGGALSMASMVMTMIFSCFFAGILHYSGMITAVILPLLKLCKNNGRLMIVTGVICVGLCATGSTTLAQVLTGTMMRPAYDEKDLAPENLSRALEDFGTFLCALIPWNNSGVFIASTLMIGPAYIPWCILLYITPIFDIIYAYTGFGMKKANKAGSAAE